MLQYKGTQQPPRRYPIPHSQFPENMTQLLCTACSSRVWTSALFSALRAVLPSTSQFVSYYRTSSQNLKDSALGGCRWCRSLADGIHGQAFLDDLYERFGAGGSESGDGSDGEEVGMDEDKNDNNSKASGQSDSEDKWRNASKFNEDVDDDPTGGWDSYRDQDTLAWDCFFSIELSFERSDDGLFTFLNVHIESVDSDEDNVPRKIRKENAVDLRYHLNLNDTGGLDADPFPPTTNGTLLGSNQNLQKACDWIQKSDQLTPLSDPNLVMVPGRLIDIINESLRIVDTASIACGESERARGFAALSYVWGTSQTFVLLSSTKNELISSFDIQQLPRTIQDAIIVARRTGFRYLWVDALCIMQDSDEDKAQELPKMRRIYQCASLTIVAAVAKSATEGFLHHSVENSYLIPPLLIPIPTSEADTTPLSQITLSYPTSYSRHKDPINTRAWTFQEWILATRILSFSYRGIETIDRGRILHADSLTSGKDPQLPNVPWRAQFHNLNPGEENLRQVWLSTRDEYSRRQITYRGDKLVAIAAIAEELGRSYGGRYLAGLWERDLDKDLQWCRATPGFSNAKIDSKWAYLADEVALKPRSSEYIAPSWSWASTEGEITDKASEFESKASLDFHIVNCEVELTLPQLVYGAVRSGTLVVKGRVHSFLWRTKKELDLEPCDGYLSVRRRADTDTELKVGEAILDALEPDLVDGCVVDCLATRVIERSPGREKTEGLMLLPMDELRHRRVGYFTLDMTFLFDDMEAMQVTIL